MQTCGLCFNEYAPRMRVPKLLPCGHDFCQSCLEQVSTHLGIPIVGVAQRVGRIHKSLRDTLEPYERVVRPPQLVACTKSAKCPACRQPLPSGVAIDNLPTVFKLMEAAPATSDGEPVRHNTRRVLYIWAMHFVGRALSRP